MTRDGASKGREGIGAGLLALHRLANPDTRKSGPSSLVVASSSPLCCIHRASLASIGPITDLIGGLATSANLSRNHALPPPDGYQEAWWDGIFPRTWARYCLAPLRTVIAFPRGARSENSKFKEVNVGDLLTNAAIGEKDDAGRTSVPRPTCRLPSY
jgi:hypothetical protein